MPKMTKPETGKHDTTSPQAQKALKGRKAQGSGAGKKSTKRGLPLIGAAVVMLLAILAVVAYFVPLLGVSKVEVVGAKNANSAVVEETSGIAPGDNMLRLDTNGAAQKIAAVPWVEKVTVSRSWPTTVTVDITEHQGIAFVKKGSDIFAVNTHGQIFLQGVEPEGAVELKKTDPADSTAVKGAAAALASLTPEVRGQLDRVEAETAESIELFLKDGRRVFWGSADRAAEKAEATRVVLTREGKEWNVSNPAMPTVRT